MRVTRARIYQLLEDCARVMSVRWPEGKNHAATNPLVLSRNSRALQLRDLSLRQADLLLPLTNQVEGITKISIDRLP